MKYPAMTIKDSPAEPFTAWIIAGEKTIETRRINAFKRHIGSDMAIIRKTATAAEIVAIATIQGVKLYGSADAFRADYDRHRVPVGSAYDIAPGGKKYGFILENVRAITPAAVTVRGPSAVHYVEI